MEARCQPPRNKNHQALPSARQRGIPQVLKLSYLLFIFLIFLIFLRYNKLCGSLRSYAHRLAALPSQDPFRSKMERQLLAKLYDMGVLNAQAKLSDVDNKLTVAAFCRRRLSVVMTMSRMAERVSAVRDLLLKWHTN